ncbi:MAG: TolC family protein [Tahibacter sp.]
MERMIRRLPWAVALTLLSGCVSVSRRDGADRVEALMAERLPTTFAWNRDASGRAAIDARVDQLLATPLTAAAAVQIAQLRNPHIAAEYARLGIAQADVVEASRLGNPTLSGSALKDGGPAKLTTGLSVPLADLLLLPARRRLASGEYERAQQLIALSLINLAADVTEDWTNAAGAIQVARMREAIATASAASATLAQRYYEAGNLNALEFKLEQSAATQARISATRARAEATRAGLALNARLGLSGDAAVRWTLDVPLATPVATEDTPETLQSLARTHRLDLTSAQREVQLLGDAVHLARRWRLLGRVEIGVERERETDGSRLTGPTLSLALPLFNQGQAAIARAEAQLEIGRAQLEQLEIQLDNDVRLGVERVAAMRAIVEDYRAALVPQREAVVKQQVDRINYMLIGPFELLLAKQQEYDAYQGYIEAVRDYWLARVALSRAIGMNLPSDATIEGRTIGVDAILSPPQESGAGHQHHAADVMQSMPGMDHDDDESSDAEPADPAADHSTHDSATKPPAPEPASTPAGAPPDAPHDHSHHSAGTVPVAPMPRLVSPVDADAPGGLLISTFVFLAAGDHP